MGEASLKARFCRASDLKRGMQILSWQSGPRFIRIKQVMYVDGQVIVKLGKHQITYAADQDVHVLEQ